MKFSDISKMETYIGEVKTINYDDWTITFSIPNIMENNSKYPTAYPVFNHMCDLEPGTEILILQPSVFQSDFFFYLPLTTYNNVMLWHKNNVIDLTQDGVITIKSKNVEVLAEDFIKLSTGVASITILKNGTIELKGNVIITGNAECTSAMSGSFLTMDGKTIIYKQGIITEVS